MDGFRALAHVGVHEARLISRRGNVYRRFTELATGIHTELDCEATLDREIVCVDDASRPQFYDLLRRRGHPVFYAFDILWLDGEDFRSRPLIEHKKRLGEVIPAQPSVFLYATHIERASGVLSRCLRAGS